MITLTRKGIRPLCDRHHNLMKLHVVKRATCSCVFLIFTPWHHQRSQHGGVTQQAVLAQQK
jgi:hypothetical protein